MNFAQAIINHHICRILRTGEPINGIVNCHAVGLHSIFLGGDTRMFFTTEDHVLHKNETINDEMSLAIHAHRFDTTLLPVYGNVINHRYTLTVAEGPQWGDIDECGYASNILDGTGIIRRTGRIMRVMNINRSHMVAPIFMEHSVAHTVSVDRGFDAAWLVMEGHQATTENKPCYTNNPVFDTADLYKPMGHDHALSELRRIVRTTR